MVSIPKTQRAWRVVTQGPPSKALRFEQDVPTPSALKPNDVLIKVQAAALNPVYAPAYPARL
jgi:NADPH:quinone reductase-like Zn-dependent oxidoreductase